MQNAEVPRQTIAGAIEGMRTDRILPYRFIAAARYAPDFEPELESAMLKSLEGHPRLPGRTRLLIDVSGSMDYPLSGQSEMTRAGGGLRSRHPRPRGLRRGRDLHLLQRGGEAPAAPRLRAPRCDRRSQPHSGTWLGKAVTEIDRKGDA